MPCFPWKKLEGKFWVSWEKGLAFRLQYSQYDYATKHFGTCLMSGPGVSVLICCWIGALKQKQNLGPHILRAVCVKVVFWY